MSCLHEAIVAAIGARPIAAIGRMYVYTVRSSLRPVTRPIARLFTQCDGRGDRSRDRSSRRSVARLITATIASCKRRVTDREKRRPLKSSELSNGENRIALRQLLQNRK